MLNDFPIRMFSRGLVSRKGHERPFRNDPYVSAPVPSEDFVGIGRHREAAVHVLTPKRGAEYLGAVPRRAFLFGDAF